MILDILLKVNKIRHNALFYNNFEHLSVKQSIIIFLQELFFGLHPEIKLYIEERISFLKWNKYYQIECIIIYI